MHASTKTQHNQINTYFKREYNFLPNMMIFYPHKGLHRSTGKESEALHGRRILCWRRIGYSLQYSWASLVTQLVKNLPAMWETWVWSLGWEDFLEKGIATHSSILTWRIPWTLYSMGLQRVGHDGVTFTNTVYKNIIFFLIYCLKISFMTIFFL